ncbi:acetyltransferase (GNAT) family protein [Roseiarcus fermentans]|uniref:Acetyltransferase (GNAT) family protein n=1 Tax=Roseiarcus fermentans TaxID=1473586 RepID=A0A366EQJ9_9HYPH|nr:GNAT family N-acetyltransferase [Roseiarcus fermentans]RBP03779.1 acetyltransferase (GNAT) family protein [Roseiarcus fermentans]
MGFSNPGTESARTAPPEPATVRPAGPDDVAAIMGLERGPGFDAFVGRSAEPEHRAMMADPGFAYRLGLARDGAAVAFAILSGLGDPHGNLYLKRVAAIRPGEGIGTAFLARVLDEAFGSLGAWRFHLDCFAHNRRAQAAYARLGFSRDGVLRQAWRAPDGTRADLVLMALLKPEWEQRARA